MGSTWPQNVLENSAQNVYSIPAWLMRLSLAVTEAVTRVSEIEYVIGACCARVLLNLLVCICSTWPQNVLKTSAKNVYSISTWLIGSSLAVTEAVKRLSEIEYVIGAYGARVLLKVVVCIRSTWPQNVLQNSAQNVY